MRIFARLVRAALLLLLFLLLLAFALNNRQEASLHWFFGQEWRTSMVFIVLATFTLGCAFGVVAMVPSWWSHRRVARRQAERSDAGTAAAKPVLAPDTGPLHPPRDGL